MLFEVQMWGSGPSLSQDEVLAILAEGPYEAQFFKILAPFGATRYRLECTQQEQQVTRIQAKWPVDIFDALFVASQKRLRLLSAMKRVCELWGFR